MQLLLCKTDQCQVMPLADDVNDAFAVDIQVIMYQRITHTDHLIPWNLAVVLPFGFELRKHLPGFWWCVFAKAFQGLFGDADAGFHQ